MSMLAALAAAGTATAQQDIAPEPQAVVLTEVVVSARKRDERLQDVPMSISAFDAAALERTSTIGFVDYAERVPNLSFAPARSGPVGSRQLAIRGVYGTGTVGFYVDDTPVPESMDHAVTGLERIEVLRGPQGTLYGARSMGGTVRLITRQPELDLSSFTGHVAASVSDPGDLNHLIEGSANLVISPERSALRIAAYQRAESGMFSRVPGRDPALPPSTPVSAFARRSPVDDAVTEGIQLDGRALVGDSITVRPRIWTQRFRIDGFPLADREPGNFEHRRLFDLDEPGSDDWQLYSLNIDADLQGGTLVSSTSLFRRRLENREDASELATLLFGIPPSRTVLHSITTARRFAHETRYVSSWSGDWQLTAGAFFSESRDLYEFPPDNVIPGINAFFGGAFGSDVIFTLRRESVTRELAAFGELSYAFTDRLSGTVGARWFDNRVDTTLDQSGIILSTESLRGRQRETQVNPKLSLSYTLPSGDLLYASASEGFRVGGVNTFSESLCAGDLSGVGLDVEGARSFDSDSLRSYEVGAKTERFDRRLKLNGSAFYIRWRDVQQTVPLVNCGFAVTVNAGEARSMGAELDASMDVNDDWSVGAAVGYTDAEIRDPGGVATLERGARLAQVPEWTGSAYLEHRFNWQGRPGFLRADYTYTGASLSPNNSPLDPRERPSYSIVNARAGLAFGTWEASVYATNLLDERANLSDIPSMALELPGRPRIMTNRSRTIGIDARVRF
jgi:outer membrane receptor protein involved in Fe transport